MIAFILSFMCLYFGASFYVYKRIAPIFSSLSSVGVVIFTIIYILSAVSFFASYFVQMKGHYIIATPFYNIGCIFMALLLYLFLCFLLVDIFRLINLIFKFDWLSFRYVIGDSKAYVYSLSCSILAFLIVIFGYFNAKFPITKLVEVKTQKDIVGPSRFALISDVHLGLINGDRYLTVLVEKLNSLDLDFVVIAGDLFDGDPNPVLNSNADKIISQIRTNYGVYAVLGNHEYIGNVKQASKFMQDNGITLLKDSCVNLPNNISLIGRNDLSSNRFDRNKFVSEIAKDMTLGNFSIVIDHQPNRIQESVDFKADMHLSGHTHAGQLFPGNFITKKLSLNHYGKKEFDQTISYTSPGYGTWGPPVRTTARPELVVFEIKK